MLEYEAQDFLGVVGRGEAANGHEGARTLKRVMPGWSRKYQQPGAIQDAIKFWVARLT